MQRVQRSNTAFLNSLNPLVHWNYLTQDSEEPRRTRWRPPAGVTHQPCSSEQVPSRARAFTRSHVREHTPSERPAQRGVAKTTVFDSRPQISASGRLPHKIRRGGGQRGQRTQKRRASLQLPRMKAPGKEGAKEAKGTGRKPLKLSPQHNAKTMGGKMSCTLAPLFQ